MEVISNDALCENGDNVTAVSGTIAGQEEHGISEEDILQQALVEASDTYSTVVEYSDAGELQDGVILNTEDVQFATNSEDVHNNDTGQLDKNFEAHTYQVLSQQQSVENGNFVESLSNGQNVDTGSYIVETLCNGEGNENDTFVVEALSNEQNGENVTYVAGEHVEHSLEYAPALNEENDNQVTQNEESISGNPNQSAVQPQTVVIQSGFGQQPLGSSQNPIRIIQQGNQYTPVQQLTPEQLQQIMQVVQQQQVTQKVETGEGSSVLFNPQTNTRIVYRVIYPSDIHKDGTIDGKKVNIQQILQTTPKKIYKKKNIDEEQERIEGPELTKEEKEIKKKKRPKTRSGRVSKPPKHMVKDFKHIHVLDYEEDYDDSDGGYSDYKVEEEVEDDESTIKKDEDGLYMTSGFNSMKPKKWKCITCEKAYIGRAGLGRHLKLYPGHGSLEADGDGDMVAPELKEDDSTVTTPGHSTTPNGINSTANSTASLSEDSRDSSYSLPYTPAPRPTPVVYHPRSTGQRGRPRGSRSAGRGRGAYSKIDPETRRKNRLKEISQDCTDEDLMEIVLPRLAKVITLWEFLLMKVEKGDPVWPHADDIYMEYEKIHGHVKKLCQQYLQYVPDEDLAGTEASSLLQVGNTVVANALGLKVGRHKVKDIPDSDTDITYKYKFLTTNHNVDIDYTNRSFLKRTVQVVSPEQLVSPVKRARMKPNFGPTVVQMRDVPNNLPKTVTVANVSQPSTSVLMTNSVPQNPILIQAPPSEYKVQMVNDNVLSNHGNQSLPTGRTNIHTNTAKGGVSLLTNTKQVPSSHHKPTSQQFIIVSGRNDAGVNPTQQVSQTVLPNSAGQSTTSPQVLTILPQTHSSSHLHTSQSVSLPVNNHVNTTYSLANISLPQVSGSSNLTANQSQQVMIAIPQSNSQPSQDLLSNFLVSEMGAAIPDQQIPKHTYSMAVGSNEHILHNGQDLKSLNTGNNFITSQSLVSTNNVTAAEQNSATIPQNVIYAVDNGNGDIQAINNCEIQAINSAQGNIMYTVDPDSMLTTKEQSDLALDESTAVPGGGEEITNMEVDGITSAEVLPSNGEVVGVINSIDNTHVDTEVKHKPSAESETHFTVDQSMGAEQTENDLNNQSEQDVINTTGAVQPGNNQSEIGENKELVTEEYQQAIENNDQVETIPAINIYQTEDGVIIIQNPDGTTVQLQGSDGENISMETVQALLAMDGETQFITEQTDAVEEQ